MQAYELAFIIKPNMDEDGITSVIEKLSNIIIKQSGEITSTDVWGRRRLAYPIKNYREGNYVLFEMNLPPTSVVEVERDIKLMEDIIRFLVFKIED
jgi:small subunit ribosomal protein S6